MSKSKISKTKKVKNLKPTKKESEQIVIEEDPKMGRPTIEFDFNQLDALCLIQCTQEECAAVLGVSADTLSRRIQETCGKTFAEYFAEKSLLGHRSLRAKQYQVAMEGDTKMLIHLGKHTLKQVDQFIIDNKSSDGTMTPTKIVREIVDNQRVQNKNLKRGTKKAGEE